MTNTTSVPTVDDLVAAYNAATGAAKAALRRDATTRMQELLLASSDDPTKIAEAMIYAQAIKVMVPAQDDKAPFDYAGALRSRAVTYLMAAHIILSGDHKVDGVPDDFTFEGATDEDRMKIMQVVGAFPVEEIRDAAVKLATAPIKSGTKAARKEGGVAAFVREAVNHLGTGFHTITKMSKVDTDTYGDDHPSTGAVAAHFATKTWADRTDYKNVTFVKKGTRAPGMKHDATADGIFVA